MNSSNPVKILVVEDNPADARLIIDHFTNCNKNIEIKHVTDGSKALEILSEESNKDIPDLMILDMNLPKVDGMAVLKKIKEDEELNKIAVIVFGTSNERIEVKNAYKSRANCYIVKPIDFDQFNDVLSSIEQLWIDMVKFPSTID